MGVKPMAFSVEYLALQPFVRHVTPLSISHQSHFAGQHPVAHLVKRGAELRKPLVVIRRLLGGGVFCMLCRPHSPYGLRAAG
jgi:hypothetical protein